MRVRPTGLLAVGGLLICAASACSVGDDSARSMAGATTDTVALSPTLPDLPETVPPAAHPIDIEPLGLHIPALPARSDQPSEPPPAPAAIDTVATAPALRHATFAFSGDTLTHSPLVRRAERNAGGHGFDFAPMFARVRPILDAADLATCHLETPIAPPGAALSTYPIYGVPAEVVTALASAGYDRCSTASNHTMDRGVAGIDATVDALEAAGISEAGMARTPEESVVSLVDVGGIAVAHLSYTFDLNGGHLPADEPWRSNIIDADHIVYAATDARHRGADVVIVSLHWGSEGHSEVNAMQAEVAERVTASGVVDLVVGHHAHVIQPIQSINGRWVVFGMGNFLSNMPTGPQWPASTQDGEIVTIAVDEQPDGTFAVQRPQVTPTWVDRNDGFVIRPVLQDLADPTVPEGVKQQLRASLERTASVVGEYIAPG